MRSIKICLLVFSSFALSSHLEAGTVKKISKKKKLAIVELDPEETATKGGQICFFSDENKKISCGMVKKIKKNRITVAVKSIKKIKVDMQARPKDSGSSETSEIASGSSSESLKNGINYKKFLGFISFGLLAPANYNKLIYESSQAPQSLWDSGGNSNSPKDALSRLGFGIQLAFPVKSFSINPGFRYRMFRGFEGENNYTQKINNPYVVTSITATEIGLFSDFQILKKALGKSVVFDGGVGMDYAISSVNFSAKKKDDKGTTPEIDLATAKSTLNVVSLRLNGGLDIRLSKKFGLNSGVVLLLPLLSMGGEPVGKFADEEAKGVQDPGKDLKEKLAHKKSSLGAEFNLGAFVSF